MSIDVGRRGEGRLVRKNGKCEREIVMVIMSVIGMSVAVKGDLIRKLNFNLSGSRDQPSVPLNPFRRHAKTTVRLIHQAGMKISVPSATPVRVAK
jgi:hypothetical protein